MPRPAFTKLRSLLAFATALVGLAVIPVGASASMTLGEPIVDPKVAHWLDVAHATWGQAPDCPAGVRVDRAEQLAGSGVWAAAEMPGCHISLDPDFYPAPADWTATSEGRRRWEQQMCNIIAHEWGHLLGHGHADDAHDLMAPVVPLAVAACRPAVAAQNPAPVAKRAGKPKKRKRSGTRGSRGSNTRAGRRAARHSAQASIQSTSESQPRP